MICDKEQTNRKNHLKSNYCYSYRKINIYKVPNLNTICIFFFLIFNILLRKSILSLFLILLTNLFYFMNFMNLLQNNDTISS